jgi:hypothetical protein
MRKPLKWFDEWLETQDLTPIADPAKLGSVLSVIGSNIENQVNMQGLEQPPPPSQRMAQALDGNGVDP